MAAQSSWLTNALAVAGLIGGGILLFDHFEKTKRPRLAPYVPPPKKTGPVPVMPPGVKTSGKADARVWLGRNPNTRAFAGNMFANNGAAIRFVQMLYAAGAANVLVAGIDGDDDRLREEGGPDADTFYVKLPADTARAQNVARAVLKSLDHPDEFNRVSDHARIVSHVAMDEWSRKHRHVPEITPDQIRGGNTLRLWWD